MQFLDAAHFACFRFENKNILHTSGNETFLLHYENIYIYIYISGNETMPFYSQTPKKLKKPTWKKFLIFHEMELSSWNVQKVPYIFSKQSLSYIFSKEIISYISENGTLQFLAQALEIKELHPGKIYYTPGNGNPPKGFWYLKRKLTSFLKKICI